MSVSPIKLADPKDEFPVTNSDRLFLALEKETPVPDGTQEKPWKVLVVDDDKEVHLVTRLALESFRFAGRSLEFINAYSGAEAKQVIKEHPDIALILLDVVMETDDAGLEVARHVRQDVGNHFVRIILRTGQPGMAPERRVVETFDINDYRAKTELTQDRMFSVVHTALSSYRDLVALARSRHRLTELVSELERSNMELEQFAYVTSHDLQAPVRGIVGFAQILQRKFQKELGTDGNEYIRYIVEGAYQMQELVQSLLTYSRVGRGGVNKTWSDINTIVEEAKGRLKSIIDERKVVFEGQSLPTLHVDATLMVQLMQNLISNAIKFQPGDSPVIHFSARHVPGEWILSVADKGIGIEPAHYKRIFQMFQRLHTSDEYEGSGIGLAICEKIIRLHKGKIWVESQPGKGCTFRFSIPDSDESAE